MFFDWLKNLLQHHACLTQTLLFAATIVALWLAEVLISNETWKYKWRHSSVNLPFIFTALPIQLLMVLGQAGIATWVTEHQWGLIYLIPGHSNPWIKYTLLFLMLDFGEYVFHRAMHGVGGFWRFHLVHHSDQKVDVSTTVREHPGETIVRNGFTMIWVFLSGAPFAALVLRQTAQSVSNILQHTKVRFPSTIERWLGWIFITPALHQTHHHYQLPYTDSNFGDVLSIWDRLFKSLRVLKAEDRVFGVDTHMHLQENVGFLDVVKLPFQRSRKPNDLSFGSALDSVNHTAVSSTPG